MEEKSLYQNRYRVPTTRKLGWDYRSDGYYFVTICTYMRQLFFGEIKNKKMILSDMGQVCHNEWIKTTNIRKNISLDAFIIMPDHAHFLVVIDNGDDGYIHDERDNRFRGDNGFAHDERNNRFRLDDEYVHDERNNQFRRDEAEPRLYTTDISMNNEQTVHPISTPDFSTNNEQTLRPISPNDDWIVIHNQNQPTSDFERISPKPGSLGTIIGTYKSYCTRHIHQLGYSNFMWQQRYHDSIIRDKEGLYRVREYIQNNPKKWRQ